MYTKLKGKLSCDPALEAALPAETRSISPLFCTQPSFTTFWSLMVTAPWSRIPHLVTDPPPGHASCRVTREFAGVRGDMMGGSGWR